ncbi:MAG: ABC transporter ATP-binding protein/permease [Planctomycetes bacterium]|nr:ABC transporter ATP-binding protein/permease [Planctomycetota bacterium]
MTLEADKREEKSTDARLFWRLFRFALPYLHLIFAGIVLIILSSAAAVVSPYIIKRAIDECILTGDIAGLRWMVVFLISTLAVQAGAALLQSVCTQMLGQKVMYDLRNRLFGHLQTLSISFFDKNPVGRLITRVTSDVENLNQLFTEGIVAIFGDLFLIAGIVTAMLWMDPALASWTFTVLPFLVIATFIFRKKVRDGFDAIRYHLARINAYLQENITGMKTVQLFLREARNFKRFSEINQEHTSAHERTILCFAVFFPVVEILSAGALALVIFKGGEAIGAGRLTFGVVYAFIRYVEMFFRPLSDLAEKYNIIQSAIVSSERIFKLLDREPEIRDRHDAIEITPPVNEVVFENVVFGYDPEEPVLKDVSFSVSRGQTLAIVGHTGAGKTTVINLLQRFYDIQSGSIRINGKDIREYKQHALRTLMVSVQQDPFIFTGTVAENIRLGAGEITSQRLRGAARLVSAAPFIEALPRQYDMALVEKGENLSTGQKQLLSFARAMAFDPEILILDEATANIDTPTETLIQSAIAELTRRRTSIIIAHRLSTIQNADKIVVLHKGKKLEEGNHQELLSRRGLYWRLYQLQYQEDRIRGKSA